MEKTKNYMKVITQRKYLPIWIFIVVQFVYHIFIREPEDSDAMWFFRNQLDAFDLKTFLVLRYRTWSSRLIIEGLLVYISRHFLVWKILNFLCWLFLAYGMLQLFPKKDKEQVRWLIMFVLLVYPLWDLSTAGWMATSLNYSWPLALGIFALNAVAKIYYGRKIPIWLGILYCGATVYGANMEQMCAILLAVFSVAILYFIYQKKPFSNYFWLLPCWLISLGEFIFILTCPGNMARKQQEIVNCMPNFESMTLLDKLSMGFMDTMNHLLASGNMLFLLYTVLLAIIVFLKSKNLFFRYVSLIPIFWNVLLVYFWDMFYQEFKILAEIFKRNEIVNGSNYELGVTYLPLVVYLLVLWCVFVSLIAVCESWFELACHCFVLVLGLASRVVMGFSPSIYVSEGRTFLYLYAALGISAIWLIIRNKEQLESKERFLDAMKLSSACILMLSIINSLAATGME